MKRTTRLVTVAVSVTAIATLAVPVTSFAAGGRPLTAVLSGANEVPPADPDGSGTAHITVNPGLGEVCFDISVADIGTAVASHIHHAPAGVNGPVVVPFAAPNPTATGCVEGVDRDLALDIVMHPEDYYVNVHTQPFPGGAVRGQLG